MYVELQIEAEALRLRVQGTRNGHVRSRPSPHLRTIFLDEKGGTGTEMSIVHNVVTMHGGSIDITIVEATFPQ